MKKNVFISAMFFCIVFFICGKFIFTPFEADKRETLIITMPDNGLIRNIETNYYKLWLEEQTGLRLVFNLVPSSYSEDYLEKVFSSGAVKTDILFLLDGKGGQLLTGRQLENLVQNKILLPLNSYIEHSVNLKKIIEEFDEYNLISSMTMPDGNLYYVPALDVSRSAKNGQIFWINMNWLKAVKMSIPTTTQELFDVLSAFRDLDPNGNGLSDEIPLAGSNDLWSKKSYNYIINSFIYNSSENARLFVENGGVGFAPITNEWRDAMVYLNSLYKEGLLSQLQFTINSSQLSGLANDPGDFLGAFTSDGITSVLLGNSQEILSKYVHVSPLAGPKGVRYATVCTSLPLPGGVILSSCEKPDAAFALLDLMFSEEAFLIAQYGEKGVDWEPAKGTDIDVYGDRATLRITNPLRDKMQNKNFAGAGPYFAYPKYADGVTWLGYDAEFFNGRAYSAYEKYKSAGHFDVASMGNYNTQDFETQRITDYTDQWLMDFIQGNKNVEDDIIWSEYLRGYKELGLDNFMKDMQRSYDLQVKE